TTPRASMTVTTPVAVWILPIAGGGGAPITWAQPPTASSPPAEMLSPIGAKRSAIEKPIVGQRLLRARSGIRAGTHKSGLLGNPRAAANAARALRRKLRRFSAVVATSREVLFFGQTVVECYFNCS